VAMHPPQHRMIFPTNNINLPLGTFVPAQNAGSGGANGNVLSRHITSIPSEYGQRYNADNAEWISLYAAPPALANKSYHIATNGAVKQMVNPYLNLTTNGVVHNNNVHNDESGYYEDDEAENEENVDEIGMNQTENENGEEDDNVHNEQLNDEQIENDEMAKEGKKDEQQSKIMLEEEQLPTTPSTSAGSMINIEDIEDIDVNAMDLTASNNEIVPTADIMEETVIMKDEHNMADNEGMTAKDSEGPSQERLTFTKMMHAPPGIPGYPRCYTDVNGQTRAFPQDYMVIVPQYQHQHNNILNPPQPIIINQTSPNQNNANEQSQSEEYKASQNNNSASPPPPTSASQNFNKGVAYHQQIEHTLSDQQLIQPQIHNNQVINQQIIHFHQASPIHIMPHPHHHIPPPPHIIHHQFPLQHQPPLIIHPHPHLIAASAQQQQQNLNESNEEIKQNEKYSSPAKNNSERFQRPDNLLNINVGGPHFAAHNQHYYFNPVGNGNGNGNNNNNVQPPPQNGNNHRQRQRHHNNRNEYRSYNSYNKHSNNNNNNHH